MQGTTHLRTVYAKTKTYAPSAGRNVKACVRSDQSGTFFASVGSHAKNGVVPARVTHHAIDVRME